MVAGLALQHGLVLAHVSRDRGGNAGEEAPAEGNQLFAGRIVSILVRGGKDGVAQKPVLADQLVGGEPELEPGDAVGGRELPANRLWLPACLRLEGCRELIQIYRQGIDQLASRHRVARRDPRALLAPDGDDAIPS